MSLGCRSRSHCRATRCRRGEPLLLNAAGPFHLVLAGEGHSHVWPAGATLTLGGETARFIVPEADDGTPGLLPDGCAPLRSGARNDVADGGPGVEPDPTVGMTLDVGAFPHGIADRERPRARWDGSAHPRPSPCRTRHPKGRVAPASAAHSGTAPPFVRPWYKPKRGQRHNGAPARAHGRGESVHMHPMSIARAVRHRPRPIGGQDLKRMEACSSRTPIVRVLGSASGFRGRTMTGGLPLDGARNVVRGFGGIPRPEVNVKR